MTDRLSLVLTAVKFRWTIPLSRYPCLTFLPVHVYLPEGVLLRNPPFLSCKSESGRGEKSVKSKREINNSVPDHALVKGTVSPV